MFEKLDIKNLEILNLGNNQIKNIDVFENVNFKEIQKIRGVSLWIILRTI